MTDRAKLTAKVVEARTEIGAAETALDAAIKTLRSGVRAEKEILNTSLESAFLRLRKAHAALAELQDLLTAD